MAQVGEMAVRSRLAAVLVDGDHHVRIDRPSLHTAPTSWSEMTWRSTSTADAHVALRGDCYDAIGTLVVQALSDARPGARLTRRFVGGATPALSSVGLEELRGPVDRS